MHSVAAIRSSRRIHTEDVPPVSCVFWHRILWESLRLWLTNRFWTKSFISECKNPFAEILRFPRKSISVCYKCRLIHVRFWNLREQFLPMDLNLALQNRASSSRRLGYTHEEITKILDIKTTHLVRLWGGPSGQTWPSFMLEPDALVRIFVNRWRICKSFKFVLNLGDFNAFDRVVFNFLHKDATCSYFLTWFRYHIQNHWFVLVSSETTSPTIEPPPHTAGFGGWEVHWDSGKSFAIFNQTAPPRPQIVFPSKTRYTLLWRSTSRRPRITSFVLRSAASARHLKTSFISCLKSCYRSFYHTWPILKTRPPLWQFSISFIRCLRINKTISETNSLQILVCQCFRCRRIVSFFTRYSVRYLHSYSDLNIHTSIFGGIPFSSNYHPPL